MTDCPHYKNNMCLWGGDGDDAVCGYDVPERCRTTEMKAEPCQKVRREAKMGFPRRSGKTHLSMHLMADKFGIDIEPCPLCQEEADHE